MTEVQRSLVGLAGDGSGGSTQEAPPAKETQQDEGEAQAGEPQREER